MCYMHQVMIITVRDDGFEEWDSEGPSLGRTPLHIARSEERRVGKECRSRWSPYH